jgi:FemAB-related protein (PEP-CTERM system-associated)
MVSARDQLQITTGVSEPEWDAYVSAHPDATVDHLWRWREIFDGVFGHETEYLAARRGPAIAGVLPLVKFHSRIFGRFVVSLPFLNYGGVLADDAEVGRQLVDRGVELARSFGARHVELRHVQRHFPDQPCRQHKLQLTRPLPQTSEALWNGLDRKIRNQVRKAQKEGLVPIVGSAELIPEFYDVFAHNMRDLGTPVYSRRLFEETLRLFPDRARVFVVRKDRTPVAAGLDVSFRGVTLVPWASSLRDYRALCPNMLLYWSMLEQAVAAGATTFDFGRSSPGAGTHAFKVQWGAEAVPLNWEYVLLAGDAVPDQGPANPRFQTAIELWKKLPLSVAGRVGPVLARHLA